MALFKIEIEDDRGIWSDVRGPDGNVLTFDNADAARGRLAELYPVLVKMEKYGGGKRTRVVQIFRTDKEWKDGTPPE
jgi:hypothetical protein